MRSTPEIHFGKRFPMEQKFLKIYANGARKSRISPSDVPYPSYAKWPQNSLYQGETLPKHLVDIPILRYRRLIRPFSMKMVRYPQIRRNFYYCNIALFQKSRFGGFEPLLSDFCTNPRRWKLHLAASNRISENFEKSFRWSTFFLKLSIFWVQTPILAPLVAMIRIFTCLHSFTHFLPPTNRVCQNITYRLL